jgi:hypothetical protein
MATNIRDGQRLSAKDATPKGGTASTSGDNIIIAAPGEGKAIDLITWSWWNKTNTETSVILKSASIANIDNYITDKLGNGKLFTIPGGFKVQLAENEALVLNLSAANEHGYFVLYQIYDIRNGKADEETQYDYIIMAY